MTSIPTRALPRLLILAPLALALAPLAAPAALAQPAEAPAAAPQAATITVTGHGEASGAPDMAVVTLGVRTEGEDAAGTLAANNDKQAAVIAALKEAGIEARDVQTSGLSLDQRMSYPDGQAPQLVGYAASNMVTVRVRDLEALGALLDKAITAGATNLANLQFQREDDAALLDDARQAAVADAIHRATLYAEAAGVALGPVRAIREAPAHMPPQPMPMMARMAADAQSAVPVEAGELGLSVEITVEFALEQPAP